MSDIEIREKKPSMDYPDNSLLEAVAKIDCEPQVKSQLMENLNNWKEKKGFPLVKYNREYVRVLLELFLLEERNISRQVRFRRRRDQCDFNLAGCMFPGYSDPDRLSQCRPPAFRASTRSHR